MREYCALDHLNHTNEASEAEKKGIEAAGGSAKLLQIKETLPDEVLEKMGALTAKDTSIPVLDNPQDLRMCIASCDDHMADTTAQLSMMLSSSASQPGRSFPWHISIPIRLNLTS